MALTFGGATSDRVNCGTGSSTANLTASTYLMWVYPTLAASGTLFDRRGTIGWRLAYIQTSGQVNVEFERGNDTTNLDLRSSTGLLAANTWQFLAISVDPSAASSSQQIYKGTPSAIATEATYATQLAGSGSQGDNSAGSFFVGNNGPNNDAARGRIAVFAVFNRKLTLGEIQSWQFRPQVMSGCVGFWHFGHNSTGTQPDWSGNGNAGTVTGATVSDHVPLGPIFGFDGGWKGEFTAGGGGGGLSIPIAMYHYKRMMGVC